MLAGILYQPRQSPGELRALRRLPERARRTSERSPPVAAPTSQPLRPSRCDSAGQFFKNETDPMTSLCGALNVRGLLLALKSKGGMAPLSTVMESR